MCQLIEFFFHILLDINILFSSWNRKYNLISKNPLKKTPFFVAEISANHNPMRDSYEEDDDVPVQNSRLSSIDMHNNNNEDNHNGYSIEINR